MIRTIAISGLLALAAVLGSMAPASAAVGGAGATEEVPPSVSCVTTVNCLAIGSTIVTSLGRTTTTTVIVARWNGKGWKRVGATLPRGTDDASLSGVSCKAAKSCLVVGDYYTGAGSSAPSRALALTWNGTTLRPTPAIPLPQGTTSAELTAVSCTTAKSCVAVGNARRKGGAVTVVETWNGAKWALRAAAAPVGSVLAEFSSLSCATPTYCVAAGDTATGKGAAALAIARWNGRTLTAMTPARAPAGTRAEAFTGVSCAAPASCVVIGVAVNLAARPPTATAFTEVWNGTQWKVATVPWSKGTTVSYLEGVSCSSAHRCEAVGEAGSGEAGAAKAAVYNGKAWSLQALPGPRKGSSSQLSGLSCPSASGCVAVGSTEGPVSAPTTLANLSGVWNGRAWRLGPGF